MAKVDLSSSEWCDLIFSGKNKAYGAYQLREKSPKRHNIAVILVIVIALVGFSIPTLIKMATPKQKEVMTEVTTLSQLEEPEIKQEEMKRVEPVAPPPPALKSSIKFTAPVIKKDEEVRDEDEIKSQHELAETKVTISIADVKGNDEEHGKDIADLKQVVTQAEPEPEKVFDMVEQMPQFPGGQTEMMQFISKNMKYPTIAQENGTQGQVIAQFVIQADGTLSDLKIVKSVDPLLDAEAMRVIKEMPKWQPGKQRGIAVATRVTVPIRFRLMDSDSAPSTDSNKNQENTIFDVVEHAPEFPGGMEACLKYMYKNIKYPAVAMEAGIQGQVVIQIVIDKDGKIHDPKIVRGVSPELNAEAVRVISNMPQWIPGKQKGKNVATRFTLPVRFRLA